MTKMIRDVFRMDNPKRNSARFQITMALYSSYIAFLVGTYSTRFTWSGGGWMATTIGAAALAGALGILIHSIWKAQN